MKLTPWLRLVALLSLFPVGCDSEIVRLDPPPDQGVYGYAHGCFAVEGFDGENQPTHLAAAAGAFAFSASDVATASRFYMQPSDLGTYLFYDSEGRYLISEQVDGNWRLSRAETLESSLTLHDAEFRSPAEWVLEPSLIDPRRYQLKSYASDLYMTVTGMTSDPLQAAVITLLPQEGCAQFPELSIDASGTVKPRTFDDGDLFGIAEIHSHIFSNVAFGGGGSFHGAPFHRLGVERALPDCEQWHGPEGRRDIVGFFFDGDGDDLSTDELTNLFISGEVAEFNHFTAGYPDFVDWPNSWRKGTHQTMYYRWIERAYLGGLRLIVQHATGNSVLCELVNGIGSQESIYSCNDMVTVDESIKGIRDMERYIDAQAGGPGQGWLRIVDSTEQARSVIADGKLAVVLGIEISNLFDCFLTPRDGIEPCTAQSVVDKLDHYYDQGVRMIFPVHKFDNGFSAGDGSSGIIELGNFINSGHYSNFVEDCPGLSTTFDHGEVTFGGLNQPRNEYDSAAPVDMSEFADDPVSALLPFIDQIQQPAITGEFCQNHGMTTLGETLMAELMKRGMMIDVAHLPQRGLDRAFELVEANQYPVLKTHGNSNGGRVYQFGGFTGTGFNRCAVQGQTGSLGQRLKDDVQERIDNGAYPSEALKFDLNGFAGGPRPRFGPDSNCSDPQSNPVTYPFTSYDGEVTFEQPNLANREVDFNNEGMIHIGLLPELIEDARRDGLTDEELEPLFRSAEAFIRMWEYTESRAAAINQ